jgi:hypothetical protein
MLSLAFFLTALAANGTQSEAVPSELDLFLKPVLDACVLPNISERSPSEAFASAGWFNSDEGWRSPDEHTLISVSWPANEEAAASCSVYSEQFSVSAYHDWFENRIGPPNSIPWDAESQVAAWRIQTNGHSVGIYLAKDEHPTTGATSPVIHILQ